MAKIPKEWGLYRPNRKLAVRADVAVLTGAGRLAGRPEKTREQSALSRSTARSTVYKTADVHGFVRVRSTGRSTGRLAQSTVPVDRPNLADSKIGHIGTHF